MGIDLTNFNAALKEYYSIERVENLVYKKNPFLALVPKAPKFPGKNMPVPLIFGNPQGVNSQFTTAQTRAGATNTRVGQFTLTRVKKYGIAVIDGEALKASQDDEGAFLEAATTEIDGVINATTRRLAVDSFRAGFGRVGVLANSSFATTIATLVTAEDATNFEIGQQIEFAATEAASTLRASGPLTVTAVDRSAGTVTFSANLSTITGIAQNDVMFISGDRENSATPTRRCVAGLQAWLPQTAPSSGESFFGLDRSVDPTRLAGQRLSAVGVPLEESLVEASVLIGREGGKASHAFLSYRGWSQLQKALGTKVMYDMVSSSTRADIAFKSIVLNGPDGEIRVIADQNCPGDTMFLLQLDTWKMASIGPLISTIDDDGSDVLRVYNADQVESRNGFYGNLYSQAPGFNATVKWQ
jgi:hypothetical protein